MRHVASVRVLRVGYMGDFTNGELVRPILELDRAKLHRGDFVGDGASRRILSVLRLLHIEGQFAEVLVVHALLVDV